METFSAVPLTQGTSNRASFVALRAVGIMLSGGWTLLLQLTTMQPDKAKVANPIETLCAIRSPNLA